MPSSHQRSNNHAVTSDKSLFKGEREQHKEEFLLLSHTACAVMAALANEYTDHYRIKLRKTMIEIIIIYF